METKEKKQMEVLLLQNNGYCVLHKIPSKCAGQTRASSYVQY